VPVQTRKKLLNVHGECQSNIWQGAMNCGVPPRADGFVSGILKKMGSPDEYPSSGNTGKALCRF
jgi:hypothetical protein